MIEHYIDEKGRAAVITSPGYGAGWSTWNYKDMVLTKELFSGLEINTLPLKK